MSTTSSKRRKSRKTESAPAAKKQKTGESEEEKVEIPLSKWRVVLTGDFIERPRASLEKALKDKGAAVTGSVSSKTTHLILGKSGRNEYGKPTGIGSKKHQDAVSQGLPVVTERDAWLLIKGKKGTADLTRASEEEREAKKIKATKKSTLPDKVVFVVQETGAEQKVSLTRMKKELEEGFGMDFTKGASKTHLKKALAKCVEEGRLEKDGASYKLPEIDDGEEDGPLEFDSSDEEEDEGERFKDKIRRLAPVRGRWRGLRVMSSEKSKSGRAKCQACGHTIAKGKTQLQLSDDSLFKMLVFPGDCHEGVSRGYVECCYPGFDTVARRKFFAHAACKDLAEEEAKRKFDAEWRRLRVHVVGDIENGAIG